MFGPKTGNKIEQHIYTRGKSTLFQQREGFGTLAMSSGLSEVFVKERIHPYCVYPPSNTNDLPHPNAITTIQYPCGKMLISQAVYTETDYTGQRAAFFAHNYILAPHTASQAIKNIKCIENIAFLTEYSGQTLEPLTKLPFSPITKLQASPPPNIDFEKLAKYITSCVYSAKKTYIIANREDIWPILSTLYDNLPKEVAHRLGFCTYSTQPIDKRGIHLIFLNGEMSTKVTRDFVFNFVAGKDCLPNNKLSSIYDLSFEKFLQEINFLSIRIPLQELSFIEDAWLEKNLHKLSTEQLSHTPEGFIKRGKIGAKPELYVILGICKTLINREQNVDLRYLLGSYALSKDSHDKICKILQLVNTI